MRRIRFLSSIAAFALLSVVLAGTALPAASYHQAAGAQHAAGTPHHKKAKPKPKKAKAKAKKAKAKKAKAKPKPAPAAALAFSGTYSGQASTKISGTTAAISANGTGTSTLIGAGAITGTGSADSSVQPCPPFTGTGTITGAQGTIAFSVVKGATGCGDDGGHNFALVGYLQITKATGALANATGQIRFTGNYSRDDGTFAIKLTGSLKK